MTAPAILTPPGYAPPPAARLLKAGRDVLSARADNAALKLTAKLFAGDHWAGGQGWTGPLPVAADDLGALIFAEVERTFVSRNLLRDVVERHRSGIAGREPLWNITPRRGLKKGEKPEAKEQARIDEYTSALTDWWDESGAWPAVQQCLDTALWSASGTIRLYIHSSALEDLVAGQDGKPRRGVPNNLTLSEAARRVSVHAPAWAQTAVTRDHDGHVTGAVHAWKDAAGHLRWEVHERRGQKTLVHPNLLDGGTAAEGFAPDEYPTPGLLIHEIRLPQFVTESMRRLSKFLNKTLTMGSRNIDLGGFTETTILNAQRPEGEWKADPDAPGGKRWIKAERHLKGAGAVNYVNGFAVMRVDPETGKREPNGVTTPSVIYKDPTPFTVFKESLSTARELIYDEAKQLHVLITGDAAANGVSRQQAVNDFLSSLEPTRMALEALVRWLLDTVLRLALFFTGRTDEAEDMRVRVQGRVSAVQPTAAEIDAALKLHEAGALSEETFMQRVGVEDVQAERDARLAEGVTPALALKIARLGSVTWVGLQALMLAFPALQITPAHVAAQRELELAPPTAPADLGAAEDEEGEEDVSPGAGA